MKINLTKLYFIIAALILIGYGMYAENDKAMVAALISAIVVFFV